MSSNHFNILERINQFEESINLNFLDSQYGNLWPLIRFEIIRFYIYKRDKLKPQIFLYRKASSIIKQIIDDLKYQHSISKLKLDQRGIEEIYISGTNRRLENKEGFNKYIDPYFNELSASSSIIIERDRNKPLTYMNQNIKGGCLMNIEPSYLWFNTKYVFHKNFYYQKVSKEFNLHLITSYFNQIGKYDLFISICEFVKWFDFFNYFVRQYPSLKRIVYNSFSSNYTLAINAVTKLYNIESVDLQHGVQSKDSFDYSRWYFINDEVLKLIPSSFWVYSTKEKELLQNTFNNRCKIQVVGNLSLRHWFNTRTENNDTHKKIILITLQKDPIKIDSFLYDFLLQINATHPDLQIAFRIHPRHKSIKNDMECILSKKGVIYTWDSNSDIYDSLQKSILNITQFSSSIEDAINLKVTSFIIDETGAKLFDNYINKNRLVKVVLTREMAINEFRKLIYKK